MISSIYPATLYEKLKDKSGLTLLDVRSHEEFALWNISGSINIPYETIPHRIATLPHDRLIITICNRGNDSKKAAQFLSKKGFKASSLTGGLKAWNGIYDIVNIDPNSPSPFKVYQFVRLGKGCLSYILVSDDKKHAVVIDPTRHLNVYTHFLKSNKLKAVAIVDTHLHADHISGGIKLAKKFKVPYLLSENSQTKFKFKPVALLSKILKTRQLKVVSTPGHTPESISIVIGEAFVFTGDTLFVDSVGRPDLTGKNNTRENANDLWNSIKKNLFSLPEEDIYVLPGHSQQELDPGGPMVAATLRYVKRANLINEFKNVER